MSQTDTAAVHGPPYSGSQAEILRRGLRDVSVRDLSTTVLGTPMPAPVALAPIGLPSILLPEGELTGAR